MRRSIALLTALGVVLSLAGCAPQQPVTRGQKVLGTAVSVAVYGVDEPAASARIDGAFVAMKAVEAQLSPYEASSTVATFNRAPLEPRVLSSDDAFAIPARVHVLGVDAQFSPALFGVTALYDFGGAGSVPTTEALASAVEAAASFHTWLDGRSAFGRGQSVGAPGLDFGGASKGLALDRAAQALSGLPTLITAGSSTLAFGSKPDGQPWRVGIEDPREVGKVLAVVSADTTLSVSTSGDYQTTFERDGVRYHHILDPKTGRPARGIRSLTVFGGMSALDADILSTALFVMGREAAIDYALDHRLGLYLVDDAGYPHTCQPDDTYTLEILAEPQH